MRPLDLNNYFEEDNFVTDCIEVSKILINRYDFYFGNVCNEIKDIILLLKKKKDYYTHKISIYYTKDECYFVVYRKNDILLNVLSDCKPYAIAHVLQREINNIKIQKEINNEKEFDKLVKTTMNN